MPANTGTREVLAQHKSMRYPNTTVGGGPSPGRPWGTAHGTDGAAAASASGPSPADLGESTAGPRNTVEDSVAAGAQAILANDLAALRSLLGEGGAPRRVPKRYVGRIPLPRQYHGSKIVAEQSTLLHLATRCDNEDAVKALVNAKYYTGAADSNDDTPLLLALRHSPRCLLYMVTHGKERRLRNVHPRTGRTFMHDLVASPQPPKRDFLRMPILEYLVSDYGVNAREPDRDGMTCLDHAQANYLQLGREADQVIEFFEKPPKTRSSATAALSRSPWELAKHPVSRLFTLLFLLAAHVIMYLCDNYSRGTQRPLLCPSPEIMSSSPAGTFRGTLFEDCPQSTIAVTGSPSTPAPPPNTSATSGRRSSGAPDAATSPPFELSNTTEPSPTIPLTYAKVNVTRYIRGYKNLYVHRDPFVAFGYRDDTVSLPFFGDIIAHVFFEWEAKTDIIAAKVLTILLGAIIGTLFFALVAHMILRDLLRISYFGYDPWVDLTKDPAEAIAEAHAQSDDEGDVGSPTAGEARFDDLAETVHSPAEGNAGSEHSDSDEQGHVPAEQRGDNPFAMPRTHNYRQDAAPGTSSGLTESRKFPKHVTVADGPQKTAGGKGGVAASIIGRTGAMLFGYHPSPAITAAAGRGRTTLLMYGFLTGIYCGGLVYNAFLEHRVFDWDVSDERIETLKMRSTLRHSDGQPVHFGELWYFNFCISLCLFPMVFLTVLDEFGQSLALQLHVPSPWFGRFGLESLQVVWPRARVVFSWLLLLVWWTLVALMLAQDIWEQTQIFSFDDLESTLIRSPSPNVNIAVSGAALALYIVVWLQSWGCPRLQSLVCLTRPFRRNPTGNESASATSRTTAMALKASKRRTSTTVVEEGQSTKPAGEDSAFDDQDIELELARQRRREKLLEGIAMSKQLQASRGTTRLTGADREEARSRTMASARNTPEEYEIVAVTDAFKVPFLSLRGNIHWVLWFMSSWDVAQDIAYFAKYIHALATDPGISFPLDRQAPSGNYGTVFERAGNDRDTRLEVLYFSLALLPAAIGVLGFLGWTIAHSGIWRPCFPRSFQIPPLPAVDEASQAIVCATVPLSRAVIRLKQRFMNRTSMSGGGHLSPVSDFGASSAAGQGPSDAMGGSTGTRRASPYDESGRTAIVDQWACAYRDDVVRLGTLLDSDPSLVNERGGLGIRVSKRSGLVPGDTASYEMSIYGRYPGLLHEANASNVIADGAPSFEDMSPDRASRMLSVHHSQRTAELLDPGEADPSFYAASPLHYAVLGNARSCVSALLARGANPRLRTVHGLCTAEELAVMLSYEGLAELLRSAGTTGRETRSLLPP